MYQRVMVTGSAGFVGAHLVRAFLSHGRTVTATVRSPAKAWRLDGVKDGVTMETMDVLDPAGVDRVLASRRPEVVVHGAAYGVDHREQDLGKAFSINVEGTANVLAAAAQHGVKRFIQIGTCYEYGHLSRPAKENDALRPQSLYGAMKAAASMMVARFAHRAEMTCVVVRPFGVWGPWEGPHKLVPQVVEACRTRTPLSLTSGEQVRDYSYVGDVARAVAELVMDETREIPSVLNWGSGRPVTVKAFVSRIAKALGGEAYMRWGALPARPDEVPYVVADTSRQEQVWPGFPVTSVEEGVQAMVDGAAVR